MNLQVARAYRNGKHAEHFAALLEAGSGSPQAVAYGNLHAVFRSKACHFVAAGHLRIEHMHIFLCV